MPPLSRPIRSDRRLFLGAAIGAGLTALAARRGYAAEPPILTITGPGDGVIRLDEAAFAALPWHDLTTRTAWTEGPQTFRGPLLRDVLALTGADLRDRTLDMRALNDYRITFPARDAWTYDPVLARDHNGRPMSRRDKGPLWLVYPRDAHRDLVDQRYDQRWVWQLAEIIVL